jgi:peptidoglycan/LPS O-acetylase OafA/YrhL
MTQQVASAESAKFEEKPGPPLRFVDTHASVLLDLLRGLAALLVLGEHWRNLFFIDYRDVTAHRKALLLPYLLTTAGHQAVVIFFVLSGYLIGGSVLRSLRTGTWSWRLYMTHRLVRLWLVLIPGLLLCLLCDETAMGLHLAPLLYGGINLNHMTIYPIASVISFKIFLGNLFFVQGWGTPVLGTDNALWSLSLEFWYYVLFPLGVMVLARRSSVGMRVVCVAALAVLALLLNRGIFLYMPIWLLGVVLLFLPTPRIANGLRWVAAALYVPVVFYLAVGRNLPGLWADSLLGLVTLPFVWVLLSARSRADASLWWVRAARGLSRFSFTLYVVHVPFLFFMAALGPRDGRWAPTAPHVLVALGMLAATLAYAYAVAWATEFRTDTVRRFVERRLGLAKQPLPSPHETVLGAG